VLHATPPPAPYWWSAGSVPPVSGTPQALAVANIGQAKYMAKCALDALRVYNPTTANLIEGDLVGPTKIIPSWTPAAPGSPEAKAQYGVLLVGQLKAIADPFYTRLNAAAPIWLAGERSVNGTQDPAGPAFIFPWTSAATDDSNKALASVGQLKATFALRFDKDADANQMADLWEINYFGSASQSATGDPDGDGHSNLQEYLDGTNPTTFQRFVSVTALVSSVQEASGITRPVFRVSIATPLTMPLVVSYGLGGSSTLGTDYTLDATSSSVVIPAGGTYSDISLCPVPDTLWEQSESVSLTLSNSIDYLTTSGASVAQIQIVEPATTAPAYFFPASGTPARVDTVCVRCGDSSTTVYYTLDGSTPTVSSPSITPDTLVRIPHGATIKAVATKAGLTNSAVVEATYPGVAAVVASDDATIIVDKNGSVLGSGWGENEKLGIATRAFSSRVPERLNSLITDVVQAVGRTHCLFLKSSGEILASGSNNFGQMGDGTLNHQTAPLVVPGLPSNITSIAAGPDTSFAVTTSGNVYAWGSNANGQLGLGNTVSPVKSPTLSNSITNVVQVASGGAHTLFLKNDGTVFAVGYGSGGRLGDGLDTSSSTPVQCKISAVTPLTGVVAVGSSSLCSYALTKGGMIYIWGQANGPIPNYKFATSTPLSQIVSFSVSNQYNVYGVDRNGNTRVYGQVYIYGGSTYGEFYDGQFADGTVIYPSNNPNTALNMSGTLSVSGGRTHVLGVKKDGSIWSWGSNFYGQLGQSSLAVFPESSPSNYANATPGLMFPSSDSDHDGIPDWLDPDSGAGTTIVDLNGNGIPDGIEWNSGYSNTAWDSDGDGISNVDEIRWGTNPLIADSDSDTVNDNLDAFPLDPTRSTNNASGSPDTTPPSITLVRPAEAVQL